MWRMNRLLCLAVAMFLLAAAIPLTLRADYPKPSTVPSSWDLTFEHSLPKRIVVQAPGDDHPMPYWYITYHVANETTKDKVLFYPVIELMTEAGQIIRSDNNIAPAVFEKNQR